jgi:hypothetical protein
MCNDVSKWPPLAEVQHQMETGAIGTRLPKVGDLVCSAWVATQPMKLTDFMMPNLSEI